MTAAARGPLCMRRICPFAIPLCQPFVILGSGNDVERREGGRGGRYLTARGGKGGMERRRRRRRRREERGGGVGLEGQ